MQSIGALFHPAIKKRSHGRKIQIVMTPAIIANQRPYRHLDFTMDAAYWQHSWNIRELIPFILLHHYKYKIIYLLT